MAEIVVIGSLNEDLVVRVARWPEAGETVFGERLDRSAGGKGANQATAAARLGGEVAMVGLVGDDAPGRRLLDGLRAIRVDVTSVGVAAGVPTGTALVGLDASGGNRIVVLPGANACLEPGALVGLDWSGVRVLLLQLEIPLGTVTAAASAAHAAGVRVVLDPAPAMSLPDALLESVDILTPNALEASALAGRAAVDVHTARLVASQLEARGPRAVIVTLGASGAILADGNYVTHLPAPTVETVDTTGAGDAFNGALAVALAEGQPLASAVIFANRVAAMSTTRPGAQAAMPDRATVGSLP
jgi:ribokinase